MAGPSPMAAGPWRQRPTGVPATVPPPAVPLVFLGASAAGLVACGAALVWGRAAAAADPTADPVVAAAHLGMLATLSMGVVGAMHQFVPVVTRRPLRSLRLAWATFASWLAASWLLPVGIGTEHEGLVEAGGALAATALALLVANLSSPLAAPGKGPAVTGLRLSLAGFVVTGCFGVLYVADRRGSWFALSGHVVLAHATVGLFAWLGLTYVSVAETLWPMFLLAHVPGRRRAAWTAVVAVPAGVALLSPGLLVGSRWLGAAGAAVLAVGLGAHLVSLAVHVRRRRRTMDLHLVFVLTSALLLVVGAGLGLGAALVIGSDHRLGLALVAGGVAATGGWLLEAFVGHAHKVVPFVVWSALRARGVDRNSAGGPLLFGDLYGHGAAAAGYGAVTAGIAAACVGLSASVPALVAVGGVLLALAGLVTATNLAVVPLRLCPSSRRGSKGPALAAAPGAGASA